MKIRVCVPLPIKKFSELPSLIKRAEDAEADLIEVRLDYLNTDNSNIMDKLVNAVERSSVPLIATNRHYDQGGHRPQNEDQRIQALISAAEAGFQYVDIELITTDLWSTVKRIKDCGAKPIISFHDFNGTPPISEMEKIVKAQMKAGAEICKLVTTAKDVTDNAQCMLLTWKMRELTNIVCFAMGRKGTLSRIMSPLFGGYFTYASLENTLETASGQISIAELRDLYRKLGVNE